jgi:hypothetical protein
MSSVRCQDSTKHPVRKGNGGLYSNIGILEEVFTKNIVILQASIDAACTAHNGNTENNM